jgi:AcrR family transcriptional regulator
MGIKERHERDREAVKRAILDAARDLFVSEGFENVSMRKIAERIEYSPAAIYSYFPSKDEIFIALAEEGVRLFADCNIGSLDGLPAIERLRRIVLRLDRFSTEHPQYFALMFVDRTVPRICHEYERFAFAREMRQELTAELQHAADEGVFPKTIPAATAFRILTMGVLGVAVMRLSGRLTAEHAEGLVNDVLNVTLAGLRTGVALGSLDSELRTRGTPVGETTEFHEGDREHARH